MCILAAAAAAERERDVQENLFTNAWTLCMKVKLEPDARGTDKGTSTTS